MNTIATAKDTFGSTHSAVANETFPELLRRIEAEVVAKPRFSVTLPEAQRLWGIDYRIEIYTPAAQRVYGYYCLLFLEGEAITARVDLKSDRAAGVLRVMAAWREPETTAGTAEALAAELRRAAQWQGLDDVVVEDRGDLAQALRTSLQV